MDNTQPFDLPELIEHLLSLLQRLESSRRQHNKEQPAALRQDVNEQFVSLESELTGRMTDVETRLLEQFASFADREAAHYSELRKRLESLDDGFDCVRAEVVAFKKRTCNLERKIRPDEDVL
jgi:ABC-type phosphate transport system auxiliary subunit